jgi:hypothetical protein
MTANAPKLTGEVVALLGADRPEDALKRLNEALANDDPKGVILVIVQDTGAVDLRVFGEVKRYSMAMAGAIITNEAVNGD